MDADTNDSVTGLHASDLALNGLVKVEDLQAAIIKKDVMLSGLTSQIPASSSLASISSHTAGPPSTGSKPSSSLNENIFVGLQSLGVPQVSDLSRAAVAAAAAADANAGVISSILTNPVQTPGQLDAAQSAQIILAAGSQPSQSAGSTAASAAVQQLLLPVSGATAAAGAIQQLISVPVPAAAAAAGAGAGQMQLLTAPGGQLINVSNTPQLGVAMPSTGGSVQPLLMVMPSVNPLSAVLMPQNAAAAAAAAVQTLALQQLSQQQQQQLVASTPQLITANQHGQVVSLGAAAQQLLQQAVLAAAANSSDAGSSSAAGKLLACLSSQASASQSQAAVGSSSSNANTNTSSGAQSLASRQDIAVNVISSTTGTAGPAAAVGSGNKIIQLVPSTSSTAAAAVPAGVGVSAATAASNGMVSSLSHITPNINQLLPNTISSSSQQSGIIVDGVNLDEMREFAKHFKIRRLSLGLTQTQVGQALSVTEGPSYSQSAICRFEKLDITPKSAQKIKPVLERWMAMAEERYKNGAQNLCDFIGLIPSKKRKRRTSFTPQALEVLNEYFERSTHPTGAEMTELADRLNFDREVIRVWFCNKRQTLKNSVKRLPPSPTST